jgi:hypothetical protein
MAQSIQLPCLATLCLQQENYDIVSDVTTTSSKPRKGKYTFWGDAPYCFWAATLACARVF